MARSVQRGGGRRGPRLHLAALAVASLLLAPGEAPGQDGNQSACEAEARRLCKSLSDEDARARCTLQRELECEDSGPSNLTRKRVRDPSAGMRSACRADFGRVCGELGGDASRTAIVACLREHDDSLSDPCRMALALESNPKQRRDFDECRAQIRNLCPGALGRDALRDCLKRQGDELDDECRRVLERRAAGGVPAPPPGMGRGQP